MSETVKLIIEISKEEYNKIKGESLFLNFATMTNAIKNGIPLDRNNSDRAEVQAYFDGQAYGWEQGRKALIDDVKAKIADSNFLNFLVNVIPPNEMEKYRDMYNCSGEKNIC